MIYKVINRPVIIKILKDCLKDELLKEIYELSDGMRSSRKIAESLNNKCSHSKVINYWREWALAGIVVPGNFKGRYKAVFSLKEYGLSMDSDEE